MSKEFVCPHCKRIISDDAGIRVFVTNLTNQDKGVIVLNPELGNYDVIKSPLLFWQTGDQLLIQCMDKDAKPQCVLNLEKDQSRAAVILHEDGVESVIESVVVFSAVIGEHLTYKFNPDKSREVFGEADVSDVPNLWDQFTW